MCKPFLMMLGAVVSFTATCGFAQKATPKLERVPIRATSYSGHEMYNAYCSSCHGSNARGNGPAAPALKISPNDLTVLRANNGGEFPYFHVESVLKFGIKAHAQNSQPEMPVWKDLILSVSGGDPVVVAHRIKNITDYLEQIQR